MHPRNNGTGATPAMREGSLPGIDASSARGDS